MPQELKDLNKTLTVHKAIGVNCPCLELLSHMLIGSECSMLITVVPTLKTSSKCQRRESKRVRAHTGSQTRCMSGSDSVIYGLGLYWPAV